jgi:hypothetical protein
MPIGMTSANAPPRPAVEHPTIRALITLQENRLCSWPFALGLAAAVTRRWATDEQTPQEERH